MELLDGGGQLLPPTRAEVRFVQAWAKIGNAKIVVSPGVGVGAQAVGASEELTPLYHRLQHLPMELQELRVDSQGRKEDAQHGNTERLLDIREDAARRFVG